MTHNLSSANPLARSTLRLHTEHSRTEADAFDWSAGHAVKLENIHTPFTLSSPAYLGERCLPFRHGIDGFHELSLGVGFLSLEPGDPFFQRPATPTPMNVRHIHRRSGYDKFQGGGAVYGRLHSYSWDT